MRKIEIGILVVLVLGVMLIGCGGNSDIPPAVPTNTATALPIEDTPAPTETEVAQPGVIVLVSPSETNPGLLEQVNTAAIARGLSVEILEEITLQTVPENAVLVVSEVDFAGIGELAEAFPDVQFLVIGTSAQDQQPNLFALGGRADQGLKQAFLAGYLAAVQSAEYRVGMISVNDAAGQAYRDAFLNGVIYFCGTCLPVYPPYQVYPLYVGVNPDADQAGLEQAARTLIAKGVSMMLVAPDIQEDGFYQYLMENGVQIVGTEAPPPGVESSWVASVIVSSGISVEVALEALLDGESLPEKKESVRIDYTGLPQSRLTHFNQILEMLNSGAIDPLGKVD